MTCTETVPRGDSALREGTRRASGPACSAETMGARIARRRSATIAVVALLLAACTGGQAEQTSADPTGTPNASSPSGSPGTSPGAAADGMEGVAGVLTEPSPRRAQPRLPYPPAGTALYQQSGFEEYCQGGVCDRRSLPDTQTVTTAHGSTENGETTVVTTADVSKTRTVRTTMVWSETVAVISDVFFSAAYGEIEYENSYRPSPPVVFLRLDAGVDESWSGEWEAETSGTYQVRVDALDRLTINGHDLTAWRLATRATFQGEFEGSSEATIWIDRATKMIVQSEGRLAVETAFGEYRTVFETLLATPLATS